MDSPKYRKASSSLFIVFVILTLASTLNTTNNCTCNDVNTDCICDDDDNKLPENPDLSWYFLGSNTSISTSRYHFYCSKYEKNKIHVPPQLFEPSTQLNVLEVSNCYFGFIDENAFMGLDSLIRLKFTDVPKLPISANFFRHIPNLKILEIINSDWYGLSPNSLCWLTKIHSLVFIKTQIASISDVFKLCARNQSFFSLVKTLNLEFNQIQILQSDFSQRMPNLEILSLKGNNIREIQNGALANLSQLTSLDISENDLTQLPDDFLSGSPQVKTLRVSNNLIAKFPSSIGELKHLEIFEAHSTLITDFNLLKGNSLRKIDVHNSSLTSIPKELCRNNPNLELLDLGRNKISSVPEKTFKNCKKLEKLILSSNNISILFYDFFTGLERISWLDLSNNNISSSWEVTFQYMTYLERLNLSSNSLIEIPSIPSTIHYFDISYNKITNIHLSNMKSLTHFYAQHNLLTVLSRNALPRSIVHTNLANNQIRDVDVFAFRDMDNLKTVNLQMNKMDTFSEPKLSVNSKTIREFYISGNPFSCDCRLGWVKEITITYYVSIPLKFVDHKNITCFKHGREWLPEGLLSEIKLNAFVCMDTDTCPKNCLCTFTLDKKVDKVDCKNRNVTDGTGIASTAKWIDFSGNNLGSLTNKSFISKTEAKFLYLNNSKIKKIAERTFTAFNILIELHLENNEIRMLHKDSLFGLSKLKRLVLKNNKIKQISPGTFSSTPSLEVLDLSNNHLKKIDNQAFIINSLQKIVLSGNPWSCNCDELKSMIEVLDKQSSAIDSKSLLCNKSQKTILEYNMEFCVDQNFETTHFYGVIIGLGIIVLFLIAGTLAFVYRIEIQILLFVRFGWRLVFKKNRLDQEDKMFDAFVSYQNSLDDFVINEMFPRLEGTNPAYKLCVHFRDFTPGATIVDNITESIENSKRTILLLNDDFLRSEWCKYEFQAAHFEALSSKLNTLIVVLLEDVNPDLVYGGLKLYIKTRTYLRYDDPRFWDRLRFALPDIKEENPVNQESPL